MQAREQIRNIVRSGAAMHPSVQRGLWDMVAVWQIKDSLNGMRLHCSGETSLILET